MSTLRIAVILVVVVALNAGEISTSEVSSDCVDCPAKDMVSLFDTSFCIVFTFYQGL